MKYLKKFENFAASTEEETEDFINQFGEESDSAQTIGWGTPCGQCNCSVEECNCGCESCASKQNAGVSFEREPYKQDYTSIDREVVIEKKKLPPWLEKKKGKKEDKDDKKTSKKDTKEDKKPTKGGKGLTAAQKRLPAGLQAAILKKKK